jgi:hypothetical protein
MILPLSNISVASQSPSPLLLLLHLYASANMIVSERKDELCLGLVMDHDPSTLFTIQLDLYIFLYKIRVQPF